VVRFYHVFYLKGLLFTPRSYNFHGFSDGIARFCYNIQLGKLFLYFSEFVWKFHGWNSHKFSVYCNSFSALLNNMDDAIEALIFLIILFSTGEDGGKITKKPFWHTLS
jgi:hypothetical protein